MILLIAHHHDREAQRLVTAIAGEGRKALLLLPEALGVDYGVSLRINLPSVIFRITPYEQGEPITAPAVSLLINRISWSDPVVWDQAVKKEKEYVASELNAFFAAFIYAFSCPVINPIEHGCVYSTNLSASLTTAFAAKGIFLNRGRWDIEGEAADIITRCYRLLFFAGECFIPLSQQIDEAFHPANLPFSFREGYPLIELFLFRNKNGIQIVHFHRAPDLSLYPSPVLTRIIKMSASHDLDHRNPQRIAG